MEPLDNELKVIIDLHTLLSPEYTKCPLTTKDLKFFAYSFAELLRARLHQCLETGERRKAESLVSEIQASMGGIAQPLLDKLRRVILSERRLFNREFYKRYPPRPRELSPSEAYEKMLRSMGHSRQR